MSTENSGTENPYQAPAASVAEPEHLVGGDFQFNEPQRVPFGRGWSWLADGFRLFARSPLIWMINFLLFMIVMFISMFIPFASNVLNPILLGGLMNGSRAIDMGGSLEVSHLFSGFNKDGGKLAITGLIFLAGMFVVMIVLMIIAGASMYGLGVFESFMVEGADQDPTLFLSIFAIFYLLMLAALLPLMMAIWFAPALIVFHGKEPFEAMKLSFMGCLRNILPFFLYSIIGTVFMVIASIPLFLGWFIIMPVFIASMYSGYKDIFTIEN